MPDIANAIARGVARFAVFGPVVQRFALVGPLLAAIIARDRVPCSDGLGRAGGLQWRPVTGAIAVAHAFTAAADVVVKNVQRHLLWPNQSAL